MVEITEPPRGESAIRDAFEWNNSDRPRSLMDLVDGYLTFYRNPKHFTTARARAGWNPEIVAVIRAYTKAYQNDARIRPESLELMRKIIREFNPSAPLDPIAVKYILKNSAKIFQHSRNVEATWNALQESGLREKLIEFAQVHEDSTLARALDREPLF